MSSTASAQQLFATRPGFRSLLDTGIAAATLAGSLMLLRHGGIQGSDTDLDWIAVLLAVGASAPLVVWRRFPLGVFAVIATASALLAGFGYPLGVPVGAGVALFLLAASRDEGAPWTRRTTAVVVVLFGAYAAAAEIGQGGFPGSELSHGGLTFAAAWFAGERTRLRREQIAELEQRALRAEREAASERRLAVAEERIRIARDLHDAAGHAVNVIAVRAGAARMRGDPERSRAALEMIEEVARQTAAEIDGMVGTLRDASSANGAADSPIGLASLDTLIADHTAAGLEVNVASEGMHQPLESAVDQAAYRIMQEALTNAARHGTGSARVELAFRSTDLELTISNAARANGAPKPNGGHGLIGMRERATLLGGSFDASCSYGEFQVRVRLPYRGPST